MFYTCLMYADVDFLCTVGDCPPVNLILRPLCRFQAESPNGCQRPVGHVCAQTTKARCPVTGQVVAHG